MSNNKPWYEKLSLVISIPVGIFAILGVSVFGNRSLIKEKTPTPSNSVETISDSIDITISEYQSNEIALIEDDEKLVNNECLLDDVYLGKDIKAYDYNDRNFYTEYSGTDSQNFNMAGVSYNIGMTFRIMEGGYYSIYNLQNDYKSFNCKIGHVDKTGKTSVVMEVSYDNQLYKTIIIPALELPQDISIPIDGVEQLKIGFKMIGDYDGYPTIGIANPKLSQEELRNKIDDTDIIQYNTNKQFLGEKITAYDGSRSDFYHEHNSSTGAFQMNGEVFVRGITQHVMEDKYYACFNLDKKYSLLEFTAGLTDNRGNTSVRLTVSLDNDDYESFLISANELQNISIPIDNVEKLIFSFEMEGDYKGYPNIGLGYPVVH